MGDVLKENRDPTRVAPTAEDATPGLPHRLTYGRPPAPPWWVAVGLWGVPSRAAARAYLWGTLGAVAACYFVGFMFAPAWLLMLLLLPAAGWYWSAIRWNDRHGGWRR